MAHLIDTIAYAGQTPWHRLGTVLTDDQRVNIAAAMAAAGLNWTVESVELLQQGRPVPDAKGIVRSDTRGYLGTVGTAFTPVQNSEAFALLEPLVDQGCTIDVMASLDGGRRTFGLLRMPNATAAIDGDDVNGYLLLKNGHDGSLALGVALTPIRVVCQNTLTLAAATTHATAFTLRHTPNVAERVTQATMLMDRMGAAFAATGDTFAQLAAREMRPAEIAAYISAVIPMRPDVPSKVVAARRETIADLVFSGAGHKGHPETGRTSAWYAYNAVTEYFDHVRLAEAKTETGRMKASASALFGGNAGIKARALDLARQLVAA